MAAEARTRELEGLLIAAQGAEREVHAQLTASEQGLGDALRAKIKAEQDSLAAKQALTAQLAAVVAPAAPTFDEGGRQLSEAEVVLRGENAELQKLLEAARERTAQLLERMRFLRQQIGAGADK